MARVFVTFVILFASTTFFGTEIIGAARIDIRPLQFDGLSPKAVNISCSPDEEGMCAKEIVAIQILKDGQRIASLGQSSIIGYGADHTPIVEAEGHIDPEIRKSVLRLSIPHLMTTDSGKYTCLVYYVEENGFVVEEKAEDSLTIDDSDVQPLVKYLLRKMFIQENEIKDQARRLKEQEQQLKTFEIAQEDKDAKVLNRFSEMENITRKNILDFNALSRPSVLPVSGQHHTASAFTAGYNDANLLTKGDIVKFNHEIMIQGDGYDLNTGKFTAPRKGIYAFQLTMMTSIKDKEFSVDIQVNGKITARAFVRDLEYVAQSSTSCVVRLVPGDVVHVAVGYSQVPMKLYQYPYSVFSGYLVHSRP